MFAKHTSARHAEYLDRRLPAVEAMQVESHLTVCERCRTDAAGVRGGMDSMNELEIVAAPDSIWNAIDGALQETPPRKTRRTYYLAAAFAFALIAGVFVLLRQPSGITWEVVRDHRPGRIGAGEWIETDARSDAVIQVGKIGTVELRPGTRVRVVSTKPKAHRLALVRGEIRAQISAPPRLFFVDTPSGTAVDLGCEYSLSSDENGFGALHVTRGWVSFQWERIESLVPAGASCNLHPKTGPGIPYFDDASDLLKQAAEDGRMTLVLNEARVRDTLTLWHLLSRVDGPVRVQVLDRIVALTPLPAGVSREGILRLDATAIQALREELAWKW